MLKNMNKKIKFNKPFYSEFIHVEVLYSHLRNAGLGIREEKEIWDLIEDIINTKILDSVLDNLPQNFHEKFMEKFSSKPDDTTIIIFLRKNIEDFDKKLNEAYSLLEKQIIKDILSSL